MSFLSGLQLLFIGLKLTHVIAWPWLVVFLPTFAGIAFGALLMLLWLALEVWG